MIFANLLVKINWQQLICYRKVCTRWKENIDAYLKTIGTIHLKNSARARAPLFIYPPQMDMKIFESMLFFHPNVKNLYINDFTGNDDMSKLLVKYVPGLKRLELNNVKKLTWKFFIDLGNHMNHISELVIELCDLDESCLSIIISLMPLVKFHAIEPGIYTRFECLNEFKPTIREIHVDFKHLGYCIERAFKSLISGNGKNILRLGLRIHRYYNEKFNIITDNMQQLEELELSFSSVRNDSLNELKKLIKLQNLTLIEDMTRPNFSVCNDKSLTSLLDCLNNLESISLIGTRYSMLFTNATISLLQFKCPKISNIKICNNRYFDNYSIHILTQCRNLLRLEMNAVNISNAGIKDLLENSENISEIIIVNCIRITEKIIDYFKDAAKKQPSKKYKLYLSNVNVTNFIHNLPSNLYINVNF